MSKVVFFNQGAGLLFEEMVKPAASAFGSVVWYSPDRMETVEGLRIVRTPSYRSRSLFSRLASWIGYLAVAGIGSFLDPERPLLFIVTNPPLSPMVGLVARALKQQRYMLLFLDMYPEAIERFARFPGVSFIAHLWRYMNRLAIQRADCVITISPQLAATLGQYCASANDIPPIHIVPTWVDTEFIHPVPKEQNWFAQKHGQVGKLTILYSGNLGTVHDLSALPSIANQLTQYSNIHFLIIGDGPGRPSLQAKCQELGLKNVTILPLQDREVLPFSLATADIGIVALARGAEGVSMPSKTYYLMAAGSALLSFSEDSSDLARVIRDHRCGINIAPDDVEGAVRAIANLRTSPDLLQQYRQAARHAAERYFSRAVCVPKMLELIQNSVVAAS